MFQLLRKMFCKAKQGVKAVAFSWDDSPATWYNRLEKMSWQEVLELKFVPRAYEPWAQHDKELWHLLWARLFRIEQPVLEPGLNLDSQMLLRVENGVSNAEIKKVVAASLTENDRPKFVVEKGGKLRGFALSPQLVIAGVTAGSAFPEQVLEQALKFRYSMLTEDDAVCVEAHWKELCQMMSQANVPSLEGAQYFQLAPLMDNSGDDYPVWNHQHKRVSYIEHDDASGLLAKL